MNSFTPLFTITAVVIAVFVFAPAEAQWQGNIPRVGIIRPESSSDNGGQRLVTAFRQGLRDIGYVEGKTIALEVRWAEGKRERFADLATELVRQKVDVIVTAGYSGAAAGMPLTQQSSST